MGEGEEGRRRENHKKYVIFFDVNVPKRNLKRLLKSLQQKAKLKFLDNRNIFDPFKNPKKTLRRMNDPDLLRYVLRLIEIYYPHSICFFFTVDGKIFQDIENDHPARALMIIETFVQRSRTETDLLAEDIINRFEERVKKIEGTA